jgi:Tfp pilus assembly major pilin PilA
MYCSRCGNAADAADRFCGRCGQALHGAAAGASPTLVADDTAALYAAYVGPRSTAWYVERFQRADAAGVLRAGWNWPAALLNFYWLLYRKQYLAAVIYALAPYVLLGLALAAFALGGVVAGASLAIMYLLFSLAALVVPGLYGTALIHHAARRSLAEARRRHPDYADQLAFVAARGGTSKVGLVVVIVLGLVTLLGILAAIAIPAYHDYTVRSRVAAAHAVGERATVAVSAYFADHGQWPATLADAGFTLQPSDAVHALTVDSGNGAITVVLGQDPVAGRSLLLAPVETTTGVFDWDCVGLDLQPRHLPQACRPNRGDDDAIDDEDNETENGSVTL